MKTIRADMALLKGKERGTRCEIDGAVVDVFCATPLTEEGIEKMIAIAGNRHSFRIIDADGHGLGCVVKDEAVDNLTDALAQVEPEVPETAVKGSRERPHVPPIIGEHVQILLFRCDNPAHPIGAARYEVFSRAMIGPDGRIHCKACGWQMIED